MNDTSIENVFGRPMKILSMFSNAPDAEISLSDAARRLGMSPMTLGRALGRMSRQGIVSTRTDGYRRYFRLRAAHLVRPMKALENAGSPVLKDFLRELGDGAALVLLYGSRATGTNGPESDWDIIVVSDKLDEVALNSAAAAIEKRHGAVLDIKLYHIEEYEKFKADNSPFFRQVMANHLVMKGELDGSGGLLQEGNAEKHRKGPKPR